MTRNTILQFSGLRILALMSAIAITTAFALGSVGDASAQESGRDRGWNPWARPWQAQQQEMRARLFIAGVTANDVSQHVDGSSDGPDLAPERTPEPSTEDSATPTVVVPAEPTVVIPPPTATPEPATPEPTAPPVYNGACPPLIYNALGVAGCKISFCESGWNSNAIGQSGEMGWFQVHPRWHADATLDPAGNVAAAVRISNGGTNWSAWSVRGVLQTGQCPNGTVPPV